jgi:hypothetical protein
LLRLGVVNRANECLKGGLVYFGVTRFDLNYKARLLKAEGTASRYYVNASISAGGETLITYP